MNVTVSDAMTFAGGGLLAYSTYRAAHAKNWTQRTTSLAGIGLGTAMIVGGIINSDPSSLLYSEQASAALKNLGEKITNIFPGLIEKAPEICTNACKTSAYEVSDLTCLESYPPKIRNLADIFNKTQGLTEENYLPWQTHFGGYTRDGKEYVRDYIGAIVPEDLPKDAMWGFDPLGRFYLALKQDCSGYSPFDSRGEGVLAVFQRYIAPSYRCDYYDSIVSGGHHDQGLGSILGSGALNRDWKNLLEQFLSAGKVVSHGLTCWMPGKLPA